MLEVTFQGCADIGVCYMPIQKTVSIDLSDESSTGGHYFYAGQNCTVYLRAESHRRLIKNRICLAHCLELSWLRDIAGIYAVYLPMLPILSGIVVDQGLSLNTRRAFWLSLSYVLASALTYTVFGVLAGLFGSNLQALFQETLVIIVFSGVFVLLALSMFGGFQVQIPSFIQTKIMPISSKQRGGKLLGAVMMGILSALAIGPCVTAPLTGALIYIGQTGDAYLGGWHCLLWYRHGNSADYYRNIRWEIATQGGCLDGYHQSHFWYWLLAVCGLAIKSHHAAGNYLGFYGRCLRSFLS